MNTLLGVLKIISIVTTIKSVRILQWEEINCTQEGLNCSVYLNNCSDEGWKKDRMNTPTEPAWYQEAQPATRGDPNGTLVPVMVLSWKAQTDASFRVLRGTEVRVQERSSQQSVCVRYIFKVQSMFNPQNKPWSFSLDRVLVEPGKTYEVFISNLPKPNIGQNMISRTITFPGCQDRRIWESRVCRENGSLWQPNPTLDLYAAVSRGVAISVAFDTDEFSEKYIVSVQCPGFSESQAVWKGNQTSLNVTFTAENWAQSCCEYVEIQPFFPLCRDKCHHHETRMNECDSRRDPEGYPLIVVILGLFLACLILLNSLSLILHKDPCAEKNYSQGSTRDSFTKTLDHKVQCQVNTPKKVLIIYSLDHPLYKDIVLKLCAFLRAKCGTEVVLDLLDQAWLGTVGRMQWLDWQKQQIEKSSDKILILCSRGVQAKWRAMCGESRVMLREDVRSPMGDMLTPAFSLIIPDLLHPVAFGRYVVAYFEDVSVEEDVPSPFNVTIKYKLMKHFEELYFRILDKEKHEPGRLNHINGISQDEYFSCPSGKALRDAIEAFQAYQLEHPDWFEKECVDSEEEALHTDLQRPLLGDLHSNPTLQCVPECCEGPPTLVNEVEIIEDTRGVLSLTPLINHGGERVYSVHPAIDDAPRISIAEVHSTWSEDQQCPITGGNTPPLRGEDIMQSLTVENHEEESMSSSHLSPNMLMDLLALQNSLCPVVCQSSMSPEENPCENRASSESDQGYISRFSPKEDPLSALTELQKICLQNSLKASDL